MCRENLAKKEGISAATWVFRFFHDLATELLEINQCMRIKAILSVLIYGVCGWDFKYFIHLKAVILLLIYVSA